jgi:diguanylate cyclase (GGDEF)-like protein
MSSRLARWAVVAALLLATVAGAVGMHLHSEQRLDDQRDRRTALARARVSESLAAREVYLQGIADLIAAQNGPHLSEFTRFTRSHGRPEGAIVSVQWLRRAADGSLVPSPGVGAAPLLMRPHDPGVAELARAGAQEDAEGAIRRAALTDRTAVSPPVALPGPGDAFYLAVPVRAGHASGDLARQEAQSVIVGLVDAKRFLTAELGPSPGPVSISDPAGALAAVGGEQDDPATTDLKARGRTWEVSVEGGAIPPLEGAVPWMILASGFGLALIVAILLGRAVSRRDAALAIARERELELERRSREDELTGLFNRRHFAETLGAALQRPGSGRNAALLLDLDHFKEINDSHGHLTGDLVLQVAAQRLAAVVRPTETLARWGGEEFAVLATGLDREGALALGERMRLAICGKPIEVRDRLLDLTASVGIAIADDGVADPDAVVGAADRALYAAKDAGRNRVRIWEPEARVASVPAPADQPGS